LKRKPASLHGLPDDNGKVVTRFDAGDSRYRLIFDPAGGRHG